MKHSFTIPSDFTACNDIQLRIMEDVEQNGFDSESIFAIRIALEEALVNAIRHGNRLDPRKKVHVEAEVTRGRAEIVVEDEGPGFDRGTVPDPTADENLCRPSGRGILLIESYMSDVSWSAAADGFEWSSERVRADFGFWIRIWIDRASLRPSDQIPMFIPIRNDSPLRRTPYMNWALIAANVVMYIIQASTADQLHNLALSPRNPELYQFFTYQFLHGGIGHLLGNMVFLYVFGNNVNDKMGHLGYLAYYLAGGVSAGIAYVMWQGGVAGMVGASGAISAVTGAYLILFPRANVTILYFFFLIGTIEIASLWLILGFFAYDLFLMPQDTGVAHLRDIGGTVFGCRRLLRDALGPPAAARPVRRAGPGEAVEPPPAVPRCGERRVGTRTCRPRRRGARRRRPAGAVDAGRAVAVRDRRPCARRRAAARPADGPDHGRPRRDLRCARPPTTSPAPRTCTSS